MSTSYRYRYRHRDRRLPIRKGTTVLTAEPFAYVLQSLHRNERCDHCFKSYARAANLNPSLASMRHQPRENQYGINALGRELERTVDLSRNKVFPCDGVFGRAIMSNNKVKKGTTVLTAKPWAYVLTSEQRNNRCDDCLKSGKLVKCAGCMYVSYCNRSCQRNSWLLHKIECPNLKRISPRVVPDMARLMARVIIKLSQGGDEEVGYYSKTGYRKFKDLMSHYKNIKEDKKRMDHFTTLYRVLKDYLKNVSLPDHIELLNIYGKICINCFTICDGEMKNFGVGIYLGPSIIDHSCRPNIVYSFDGTSMIIRTIEDIPSLDWSVMKISYIDLLKTKRERRAELQSSYYFLCTCKRCEAPEPTAEAAACPNKSCTYPCSADAYSCGGCNTKFPEDFHKTFDEVSDFTALQLQKMDDFAYLDISKVCLEKQRGVLHPLNIQHVQTIQAAFDSCMALNHFEEVIYYGTELIKGCQWYYGEVHPWAGILYVMIGKSHLVLKNMKEAAEALQKALKILRITFGEHHSFIRKDLKLHLLVTCYDDWGWK